MWRGFTWSFYCWGDKTPRCVEWVFHSHSVFYWIRSTAGVYLHTSAGLETLCSQPYIWYRCRIPPCWHTPHQDTSHPGYTHSRLKTQKIQLLKLGAHFVTDVKNHCLGEIIKQPISYLHISVHQQMVQTQACSPGKCKNLQCWCKFPQGTHYQLRTRWHLTKRNNLQTLHRCRESYTRWEVCSDELRPTALDNPLQTFAGCAVWGDLVTMVTGTFVGAVQIDTAAAETNSRKRTLILI